MKKKRKTKLKMKIIIQKKSFLKKSEKKSNNDKSVISKSFFSSSYIGNESKNSEDEGIDPQDVQFRKAIYLGNIALRLKNQKKEFIMQMIWLYFQKILFQKKNQEFFWDVILYIWIS